MKKLVETRNLFQPLLAVLLFVMVFNLSCLNEDGEPTAEPTNNETKDIAEYNLNVSGESSGKSLIGYNVSSNWDSNEGIIWLGTDENNLPTGTLTIIIDSVFQHNELGTLAIISSATLSTTDKLVGTSAELNPKLYLLHNWSEDIVESIGPHIFLYNVEIGANYITATMGYEYEPGDTAIVSRLPMREATTDEFVVLSGTFTALSSN